MCYLVIEIEFSVYYLSSSIFNYLSAVIFFINFPVIKLGKALNRTFGSVKFCSKDLCHFLTFTRLTILEFD